MSTKWKYVDSSNKIVSRTTDNGNIESCLVAVISDWIAAGNTPDPSDVPEPVIPPITVSPWQIRKSLNALELRDAVETAVAASDQTTKDAWQYATAFVRTDPLVAALGAGLGKTEEELDGLFELAASL